MRRCPAVSRRSAVLSAARRAMLALAVAGTCAAASAAGLTPDGAYVQAGGGEDGLAVATAGAWWSLDWQPELLGARFSTYVDGSVSALDVRGPAGDRRSYALVALVPYFRYTFDEGRSPWFVEGGVGVSLTNRLYRTSEKAFSTAFNFSDNIAVGYRLSPRSEISLRLEHVSNGSIKRPNPGENLLLIRYAFSY